MEKVIKDKHGNIFKLVDVVGDGNCLFHSVVKSEHINISQHDDFRNYLVRTIEEIVASPENHQPVLDLFRRITGRGKITEWLDQIRKSNTWGDEKVGLFIAYIYNVNVVIISNLKNVFHLIDVKLFSKVHQIQLITDAINTIYLYHFTFHQPFTPSTLPNHFGFLRLLDPKVPG